MRRTVLVSVLLAVAGCAGTPAETAPSPTTPADKAIGKLPESTTFTTIRNMPADPEPSALPDGTVVRPLRAKTLHAKPGGPAVAVLPAGQLGGPTWVPVVETVPGWHRVLLPSKPNRRTGWVSTDGLETARSPYAIRVRTGTRKVTVLKSGKAIGTWTVAVGAPKTPTPHGRTFLLASLNSKGAVMPVGAHSATLDTFGGGPGTVAFHGWPDAKVFGRAASHGCVRVPAAALKALEAVPLGSPVLITS